MQRSHPIALHRPALAGLLAFAVVATFAATALASGPSSRPSTARYETRFLTMMIDHHSMALVMGDMCLEKATHPELLELCQAIIDAQSAEIDLMTAWLLDWYGIEHEFEMKKSDERMMEKMDGLEGGDFETEWLREMIMHHEVALRHAAHCHHRAEHEELHELCSAIEATQSAEIEQMEEWLCAWYGSCRP